MRQQARLRGATLRAALACGGLAPLVYIGGDIHAGLSYPGYSFADQAVSELFAIGAPTSQVVVRFFTLSSGLLLMFSYGLWKVAREQSVFRTLALMAALNAVVSLALWNAFPMHMRGIPTTFTDTMHGILATNPFPLVTILVAAIRFRGWLRVYSWITLFLVGATAIMAFVSVPAYLANEPTPWMGATERAGQYLHQGWHAVFAAALLAHGPAMVQAWSRRGRIPGDGRHLPQARASAERATTGPPEPRPAEGEARDLIDQVADLETERFGHNSATPGGRSFCDGGERRSPWA